LTETEVNLIKQYKALLATENVTLEFGDDAITAVADLAAEINASVENIGARRLHTVLEKLLEDISFSATDKSGETFAVDAAYVKSQVGELAKKGDLSRFIL
ncbi:MAG: HslU--HslV peptidase ATPase subunit, partial [Rhodospirillaceae bacterium]